jgi:hypothetical protein
MQCEEVRNELAGRLVGDLDEPVAAAVREHLAGCSACRQEAEAFEETWTLLERVPAEPMDSDVMRARFQAALDLYREGLTDASPRLRDRVNRWMSGWWPRRPLAQAAFAALLLAVGVGAGRGLRPSPRLPAPDPAIAELRQELQSTRQMVMLSLLQQQSAAERLRGVSWSSQIDQPGNEVVSALVDSLMHDPNVNVRLACIDALHRFNERPDVRRATVEALTEQPSPLVQIALIDFVVETNDRDAVGALRRLASDTNLDEAVRGRANWGVQQLG